MAQILVLCKQRNKTNILEWLLFKHTPISTNAFPNNGFYVKEKYVSKECI